MRQTRILHLAAVPAFMLAVATPSAAAWKPAIQQLFAFTCDPDAYSCANGNNPDSLLQSADGNYYDTTEFGGTGNAAAGTVFNLYGKTIGASSAKTALFRLTLNGEFDTLHPSVRRQFPNRPSTETADGKLYGAVSANQDRSEPDTFGSSLFANINTRYTLASSGRNYPNGMLLSSSEKGNALNAAQFCGMERNETDRQ